MKLRNNSAFIKGFEKCKMNTNNLPKYIDIARHYLCIIDYNMNVEFKEMLKSIKLIWNRSSILISDKGINIKFDRYMVHINTLRKKSNRIIFDDLIKNHFEKYDFYSTSHRVTAKSSRTTDVQIQTNNYKTINY